METIRRRGQGRTMPRSRSESALTPRERFEASAEKIALTAAQPPTLPMQGDNVESDVYDSTPFGLRRRLQSRNPLVGQEHRHDSQAVAVTTREDPARPDAILMIRRACLDAARELLLEMVMVDAELARSPGRDAGLLGPPAKGYLRLPASAKTMSLGSEGSFSRRR